MNASRDGTRKDPLPSHRSSSFCTKACTAHLLDCNCQILCKDGGEAKLHTGILRQCAVAVLHLMLVLTEQLRKEKDDLLLHVFTAAIHSAQEHPGDGLLIGKAVQPASPTDLAIAPSMQVSAFTYARNTPTAVCWT